MAYASQAGRARTSVTNPEAHAICDRCGFRYNFADLNWQFEWYGSTLQNIRILVCRECQDVPQEQLRAITLPADPVPIINARPELYPQDSLDYIGWGPPPTVDPQTGISIPSQDVLGWATSDQVIIPPPIGPDSRPNQAGKLIPSSIGVTGQGQMTPVKDVQWARSIPITSIVANGTAVVTVNCSSPHQLTSGGQISIVGTTNPLVFGIYTVTVTTGTVFTIQANANVTTGTISTSTTIVETTNAGLPWQVTQVPQTGV